MQFVAWIGLSIFWMFLAYEPVSRSTWVLENILFVGFLVAFLWSYRIVRWSRLSCSAILMFLILHLIGAHFTYSLVPYDAVAQEHLGFSLNRALGWERNQYDRIVHFCYGLLFAFPISERLGTRFAGRAGAAAPVVLIVMIVMSTSLLYELIEWGAAELLAGEQGMAFLGTQGDLWDAHKDMALATLGSLLGVGLLKVTRVCMYDKAEFVPIGGPP